jgi:hypothetical protein
MINYVIRFLYVDYKKIKIDLSHLGNMNLLKGKDINRCCIKIFRIR